MLYLRGKNAKMHLDTHVMVSGKTADVIVWSFLQRFICIRRVVPKLYVVYVINLGN